MTSKNRVIYLLLLLIIGFAGYYFGQFNNQQTNALIKPVEKNVDLQSNTDNKPKTAVGSKAKPKIADKSYQHIQAQNPYLPEYLPNQQTLDKIVDNLPTYQIDEYFDKLIAKGDADFAKITNKHTLAKSLMREFLSEQNNQNIDTNASIEFSLSATKASEKPHYFKISNSKKTLYAHLQLDEYQAMISNTFIKWVHTDSGRVLLFTKKNINPITRQNWVSLTPDENWQTGNYQVIFYQFNQDLTPIIQGNYHIE